MDSGRTDPILESPVVEDPVLEIVYIDEEDDQPSDKVEIVIEEKEEG